MFILDKLPRDVLIKQIWWNKYAKIRKELSGNSTLLYSYTLDNPVISVINKDYL